MAEHCKNGKELNAAMKKQADEIYIEGDLKNMVFKVKAVGSAAWGACAGVLSVAIAFIIASIPTATATGNPTVGAASFVSGTVIGAVAAPALGSSLIPIITLGVATGGIKTLTTLRDKYKIVEKTDTYIKLKRKRRK